MTHTMAVERLRRCWRCAEMEKRWMLVGTSTSSRSWQPVQSPRRPFSTTVFHENLRPFGPTSTSRSLFYRTLHTSYPLAAAPRRQARPVQSRRTGVGNKERSPLRGLRGRSDEEVDARKAESLNPEKHAVDGYPLDDLGAPDLSAPEIDYLKEKLKKKHGTPVQYVPKGVAPNDLKGLLPELAQNARGLQETVEAWMRKEAGILWDDYTHELDTARRLLRGQPVLFESDEHRERVLEEAKLHIGEGKMRGAERKQAGAKDNKGRGQSKEPKPRDVQDALAYAPTKPIEFKLLDGQSKEILIERFVRGNYIDVAGKQGPTVGSVSQTAASSSSAEGILTMVQTKTRTNETYTLGDQSRFVDKVKKVFEGSGLSVSGSAPPPRPT